MAPDDKLMLMDFLAMPTLEQLEVLEALVSANHQFQENETTLKSRLSLLEDVVEAAKELIDVVSDHEYTIDSLTFQPLHIALAELEEASHE